MTKERQTLSQRITDTIAHKKQSIGKVYVEHEKDCVSCAVLQALKQILDKFECRTEEIECRVLGKVIETTFSLLLQNVPLTMQDTISIAMLEKLLKVNSETFDIRSSNLELDLVKDMPSGIFQPVKQ